MNNETETRVGKEGLMSRLVANLVGTSYEAFKKKMENTSKKDHELFVKLEDARIRAEESYNFANISSLGQEVITLNEQMITFHNYLITRHTQDLQRSALEGDYDSYLGRLESIRKAQKNISIYEKVIREVKEDQLKYGGQK